MFFTICFVFWCSRFMFFLIFFSCYCFCWMYTWKICKNNQVWLCLGKQIIVDFWFVYLNPFLDFVFFVFFLYLYRIVTEARRTGEVGYHKNTYKNEEKLIFAHVRRASVTHGAYAKVTWYTYHFSCFFMFYVEFWSTFSKFQRQYACFYVSYRLW